MGMPGAPDAKEHALMTEPGMESVPDPSAVSTEDELLVAVLALLGDSYDRAVERRTGLSKTTVNDLRNGRRRLTAKTLTLIVEAYDPARREAWLTARRRVLPRVSRTDPPAGTLGDEDSADNEFDHPLHGSVPRSRVLGDDGSDDSDEASTTPGGPDTPTGALAATPAGLRGGSGRADVMDVAGTGNVRTRPTQPDRRWSAPWRTVWLTVGAALLASALAALVTFVTVRGDSTATARLDTAASAAAQNAPPAPPGPAPDDGRPPGAGPPRSDVGGRGAAGPVGGPGPPRADMSPPAGGVVAVRRGCDLRPAQTPARLMDQPGTHPGVRLAEVRYTYYPAWHPSLAVGGRLSGPIPDGWRLLLAAWADPTTTDSTVAHNAGNGRYYPSDELAPTDQNCFAVPPYSLGYGGYGGMTTRLYALLVDTTKALPFLRSAGQFGGLADADLDQWDVRVLGYAVIPSRPE